MVPTRKHLFDMVLSVLALNGYQSVKFNYEHFIAENSPYQLKSYYYTLNESKIDMVQWMQQLPPARTGTRGRPKMYGDKLTLEKFELFEVQNSNYSVGYLRVLTHLFGKKPTLTIVTRPTSGQNKRLFLCSNTTGNFHFDLEFLPQPSRSFALTDAMLMPLSVYSIRWNIEVTFYQQKTFWALGDYMLCSHTGIERLLNLLSLIYAIMLLLLHLDDIFQKFQFCSSQQTRFFIGDMIHRQLFFDSFMHHVETLNISSDLVQRLKLLAMC